MKKRQGAKGRSSFLEAEKGACAGGKVGEFLRKLSWRETRKTLVIIYEEMKHRTAEDNERLEQFLKERAGLEDELINILHEAVKIDSKYPNFLTDLAKAAKVTDPVYPAEVRMLSAYNQMICPAPNYTGKGEGWPPLERKVSYDKLHLATQDVDGNPDKFQFSRMVQRYGLKLERGKPGRKSQIKKHHRVKKTP